MEKNIEKQTGKNELEIQLVTSESAADGACGPDTCPWIGCDTPSN